MVSKTGDGGTVEWPLIILRGNGSIYVTLIGVDTEKYDNFSSLVLISTIPIIHTINFVYRPHIQGPLTMYPSTQDNYGVDSCSILVLPTSPPTVIIAEPSGKLFHAILLESEPDEEDTVSSI